MESLRQIIEIVNDTFPDLNNEGLIIDLMGRYVSREDSLVMMDIFDDNKCCAKCCYWHEASEECRLNPVPVTGKLVDYWCRYFKKKIKMADINIKPEKIIELTDK